MPDLRCSTEDFRLYTLLFRADPADTLLVQIKKTMPFTGNRSWIAAAGAVAAVVRLMPA